MTVELRGSSRSSSRMTSPGSVGSSRSTVSLTGSSKTSLSTTEDEEVLRDITFDPDGDLRLVVGTDKVNTTNMVVCSRALSRASPVFRAMLYGPWAESRPKRGNSGGATSPPPQTMAALTSEQDTTASAAATATDERNQEPPPQDKSAEWVIELPDDDPRAFRALMGIIHSAFDHVPESMGVTELFQVAILTDKYDMRHLLRPWEAAWCQPHQGELHPYRLWIAWVLGDASMFESEARSLVKTCPANADGQLLVQCTDGRFLPLETFDYLRVPDILASIAATRFEVAEQLLEHLDSLYRNLASADGSACKEASYSGPLGRARRLDCENALLGSTVKALIACELWPIPSAPLLTLSLDELVAKMTRAAQMIRPMMGDGYRHVACNPAAGLANAVRRITAEIPSPVQHFHLAHMAMQAARKAISSPAAKVDVE